MVQLGEHFKRDDSSRHPEWLRQQRWFIRAREDREQKQQAADKLDDNLAALASEVIAATEREIFEFQTRLDKYDEATVVALMENQELLDAVNTRLEAMLANAYVMEDGRRVFKTLDGSKVFDEFGAPVSRDELDYDLITPDMPAWETYQPDLLERERLLADRDRIYEFQEKVDGARAAAGEEGFSKAELDDLDAELLEAMPQSVRAHVPGMEPASATPNLKTEFTAPADPAPQTGNVSRTPVITPDGPV